MSAAEPCSISFIQHYSKRDRLSFTDNYITSFEKSNSLEDINIVTATREEIIFIHIRTVPTVAQHLG